MHIYGPAKLHSAQPINAPHTPRLSRPDASEQSLPIKDELQISDVAQWVDEARQMPEIRQARVNEIRAQIAEGTYETDEKLDIAMGRLFDQIG